MDFNALKTDREAEVQGKWFPVGTAGAKIKVARTGNPRYREMLRTKLNLHRGEMDKGLLDLDVSDEILCEVIAETILLGWEGFTDDGKPSTYTKELAREKLLALPDFRDIVVQKADSMENYKIVAEAKDLGNSSGASSGTSGTQIESPSSKGSQQKPE